MGVGHRKEGEKVEFSKFHLPLSILVFKTSYCSHLHPKTCFSLRVASYTFKMTPHLSHFS